MQTSAPASQHISFTLPVCKDCAHVNATGTRLIEPQCLHPEAPIVRNLVTGIVIGPACHDERRRDGPCGMEGKRFEPVDPDRLDCDTHTREDAKRLLACADPVEVRMPYSSRFSWIRRCHTDSILARSASMAESSMTACSGCASLPNSCLASSQAPCSVSATDSMASPMNGGDPS